MLVKVILLLALGLAQCQAIEATVVDQFFVCRLRVSNVSKETADRVRNPEFDPQLFLNSPPNPALTWLSVDTGDDPTGTEVLYRADIVDVTEVVAVSYPALQDISDDQITIRCSNGTAVNTTYGVDIIFTESYNVTLGTPIPSADGRVRRPATFHQEAYLDCFDRSGYLHEYDLNPVQRYVANEEYYELDCSSINKCTNGELSGFTRCPPHHSSEKFVEVRTVGSCCEDALEKSLVEEKGCPKDDRRDHPNPVPWQVRFENKGKQCDGIIISKHWFLTLASCLRDTENIEFSRPHSIKYQPVMFRNVTIVDWKHLVENETTLNLAVARISQPFVTNDWTTSVQKINLPWSKSLCESFLDSDCTVVLGTDQNGGTKNEPNVVATIPTTVKRSVKASPYVERILKAKPLPVLTGGAAASWFQKTYFLVGVYMAEDSTTFGVDNRFGNMIRICPYLATIREHIRKLEEPEKKRARFFK